MVKVQVFAPNINQCSTGILNYSFSFLADLNPGGTCTTGATESHLPTSYNLRMMLLAMLMESGALYAQLGVT